MDCVSPIFDIVTRLWDCSAQHRVYVSHLERNLEGLESAMDELRCLRADVKEKVEIALQRQRQRLTHQAKGWLGRVDNIEQRVSLLIEEGNLELKNKLCLGCCPKNMRLTYKIGKKVVKMLEMVRELLQKGQLDDITERVPRPRVSEWPMEATVGLDSMVETVWRNIEDTNVGIIGLYGIGGVGKTTLLKKINNEFSNQSHGFDVVIWVTLPKPADNDKFQEMVRKKLEIPDDIWNECSDRNDRASEIFRALKSQKFVLLLDDVQEGINFRLTTLGIPLPNNENQSKVIFATRSEELCGYMGAQVRVKVECLTPEQALSLFSKTVGEEILNSNPEIPSLAGIVARRCRGLPLALLTVGRAMASRRTLSEWSHAVQVLCSYPSEFPGMGDHVFPLLKFSYDSLTSETAQKCFLYCSLFLENHIICVDELIDLWIGEGFLDGGNYPHLWIGEGILDRANPRRLGEFIIGTLKLACLLESDESAEFVWMHDMIREMALWLARDQEENKNKVLVAKDGRLTDQEFTKWAEASCVSLWGGSSREIIDYPPSCHNLSTLLVRDTLLQSFPSGFFDFMSSLQVLDLSGNQGLVELPPEIGILRTLQYLNLSLTSIRQLPTGLANLRNLRCLLLDYNTNLKGIPPIVISCLSLLQVYSKMNGVMDYFDEVEASADDEIAFLEVLEKMSCLNKICITIFAAPSVEMILNSFKLRHCIRKLTLMECSGLTSLLLISPEGATSNRRKIEIFRNLTRFELFRCCSLKQIIMSDSLYLPNLHQVYIGVCPLLLNLNCLAYAINLKILTVLDCESMEEIISESSEEEKAFPKLKTISLTRLRKLKSISRSPISSSSLFEIEVSQCPSLKQLPLDIESADFLKKIRGETEWWEGLIWDREVVKDACSSKFVSTSSSRFRPPGKTKDQISSTSKG